MKCAALGQAMLEFLIAAAALAAALLFPFIHGRSMGGLLLHAMLEAFRAQSFLISVM